MPGVSTVKRLPPEIRDEVHRLLESGRTLDAIVAHLRGMGVEAVSRSALGRYKQHFDRIVERVRRSREIADALVRNFGQEDEHKSARANIEMMHAIVSDMLMQIGDPDDPDAAGEGGGLQLDARQAHDLAKALDHLAKARKADQDAIVRAREEGARAEAKAASERMEASARRAGVSDEVIRTIRRDVLRMAE
ncbi:MAG: DUF3486 family protein [Desulfovibrio sp.]|nr:DUF3486 family protein [Desulfovibrio sp.]MCA1986936.1 DUF3486 family protein [Desulfovibrio sp.]